MKWKRCADAGCYFAVPDVCGAVRVKSVCIPVRYVWRGDSSERWFYTGFEASEGLEGENQGRRDPFYTGFDVLGACGIRI